VPDVWFAIPGDLNALTGGYGYARRLMAALPATGWTPHHVPLPGSFPNPSDADLETTRAILAQLPPGAPVLADGLAFGALPAALLAEWDASVVALVHHPLADETGLSDADIRRFKESERTALGFATTVVATSPHTAECLVRDYSVPTGSMFLAVPGTDPAARADAGHDVPTLLTVATLTHRKGHDVLIEALAGITDLPWTSALVGSTDRDAAVTARVRALIERHQLQGRVILRGELHSDALNAAYAAADVFVLPSRHEGYGMVFAEALARGLPIVACAAGAVTDTVPSDAGLLVPVDNPIALAAALRKMLTDAPLRRIMGDAAWKHGQMLPTWDDTAAHVAEALWEAA
jgi:glycosyltransferase involved in cell wall biosynthesis